jgi:hypothetical protein
MNHIQDTSLKKKGDSNTWTIPNCKNYFSRFRIMITGLNSSQHYHIALSRFEIYGYLVKEEQVITDMVSAPVADEEKVFSNVLNLKYESDFDTNGLVYFLGSRGKTEEWMNPSNHCY